MTFEFSEVDIFSAQSSENQPRIGTNDSALGTAQHARSSITTLSTSQHSEELFTLALADARTDKIIATFDQLSSEPFSKFDNQDLARFSIVGVINQDHADADSIQSIKFESDYGTRIDNIAPYAIFGDRKSNLWGRAFGEGTFQVQAKAYSGHQGKGSMLDVVTLNYSVSDDPVQPAAAPAALSSSQVFSIGLLNSRKERLIPGFENLESGSTINLNDLGTDRYSLVATINQSHTQASRVKSIKFESQYGMNTNNFAPYSLLGDDGKGNIFGRKLKPGNFSLKATAFDGIFSTGKALQSIDFDYTFVDTKAAPEPVLTSKPRTENKPVSTPKSTPSIGEALKSDVPTVIYDTDISADADDAGALGVLHTLADQGKANISAVVVNGRNADNKAAQAVDAINTYYDRPNIPIGTENAGHISNSRYTKRIADEFPNDAPLDNNAPKALNVYRDALKAAKNNSITIVSVGLLTNLQKLLQDEPDLINQKVKKLVVMGGRYPNPGSKPEFNFQYAPKATKYVLDNWPTEIIFSGAEIGLSIQAGTALQATQNHPVARAYELHRAFGGKPAIEVGKASFDHTAVMIGVLGVQNNWNLVSGTNTFNTKTLKNTFIPGAGKHKYITQKRNPDLIALDIDRWMVGV